MSELPLANALSSMESRRFRIHPILRGIGNVSLLASVGVFPLAGSSMSEQYEVPPEITQSKPEIKQPLDELQAVIINHPQARLFADTQPEDVKRVFRMAGRMMNEATQGAIPVPVDVPVHTIAYQPTGTKKLENGFKVDCVSDEDIENARQVVFSQKGIPLTTRTAVFVNTTDTCYDKGAWAMTARGGGEMTVYNMDISPRVAVHEETHVEGIGHAAEIECGWEQGEPPRESWGAQDVATLIEQRMCVVPLNREGEPHVYSNINSVMGSKPIDEHSKDFYLFTEINALAPDVAIIKNAKPEKQQHILSVEDGQLRGLRFELPNGHPLHRIDSEIKYINIGFEPHLNGQIRAEIIATGAPTSYAIEYPVPYITGNEAKNFGSTKRVIYTDAALGIVVAAEDIKNQDGYMTNKSLVSVETIPR